MTNQKDNLPRIIEIGQQIKNGVACFKKSSIELTEEETGLFSLADDIVGIRGESYRKEDPSISKLDEQGNHHRYLKYRTLTSRFL